VLYLHLAMPSVLKGQSSKTVESIITIGYHKIKQKTLLTGHSAGWRGGNLESGLPRDHRTCNHHRLRTEVQTESSPFTLPGLTGHDRRIVRTLLTSGSSTLQVTAGRPLPDESHATLLIIQFCRTSHWQLGHTTGPVPPSRLASHRSKSTSTCCTHTHIPTHTVTDKETN
jgi:hypothetical protein